MSDATMALFGHPIRTAPYTAIRFSRFDHQGTAIYRVGTKEAGCAETAMRVAHDRYGSNCFYCGKPMPAAGDPKIFTRDHIHPRVLDGSHDLHNLVFSCRPCNEGKGVQPLTRFSPDRAVDYAEALHHLLTHALATAAREAVDDTARAAVIKLAAAG